MLTRHYDMRRAFPDAALIVRYFTRHLIFSPECCIDADISHDARQMFIFFYTDVFILMAPSRLSR